MTRFASARSAGSHVVFGRVALAGAAFALASASCTSEHDVGTEHRYLLGAYAAPASGSGDDASEGAVVSLESDVGRRFDIDRIFHQWDDAVPAARESWTIAQGRTPIVSFKSESAAGPIRWSAIANGGEDAFLTTIADAYRGLGAPALVLFHQKPEEDAAALGSEVDYKASFRHIVALFRARGANNVRFVFNMKSSSFPAMADAFYPGDDVVDWIGVQAFNYGAGEPGGRWISFRAVVTDFYAWARPHGKPLLAAEWGCVEDPAIPDRKSEWIRDVQGTLDEWPELRALSYSDGNKTATLSLRSSPQSLAAFRALAGDPSARPR